MKICIISDTHNKHKYLGKLPDADMIIHCGDFTSVGHPHEIVNFMQWYLKLPYKYKIIIAGNHDMLFEKNRVHALEYVPDDIIYLEDSGVEIEGFKLWGTPVQKPFNNWAFNRPEEKLALHWKAIPDDIDILITHNPPYMIMDYIPYESDDRKYAGSPSLYWEVIERIKPKLHCFGHIHGGYGMKIIENTTFINASNLNEDYLCVNEPVLIEI